MAFFNQFVRTDVAMHLGWMQLRREAVIVSCPPALGFLAVERLSTRGYSEMEMEKERPCVFNMIR